MAPGSAIHGIAIRQNSASPRQSNLTSALQNISENDSRYLGDMNAGNGPSRSNMGRHESVSMSGLTPQYSSGTMPISMTSGRSQPRRESMAGSMMAGISWGGMSMNSWIRDDIVMQGTSPFSGNPVSPSYHSSSYLPKLEANFMKDFACCGQKIPSLHDLLAHYEQDHANETFPSTGQAMSGAAATASATTNSNQQNQVPQPSTNITTIMQAGQSSRSQHTGHDRDKQLQNQSQQVQSKPSYQGAPDMDIVEDMELDDGSMGTQDTIFGMGGMTSLPLPDRQQFGQTQGRVAPLDLSVIAHPLQNFQGIRQSQQHSTPTTPVASRPAALYHSNPTVSSVNTPTLTAHPRHQQLKTPDSSTPGTPVEVDADFDGGIGGLSMNTGYSDLSMYSGNGTDIGNLYIDEPAKRLFTNNAGGSQKQTVHQRLGNMQYGADSPIAKTIREQQRKVGLPDSKGENGEEKPFRCPVIGCEKAYKNQNGLKYHKSHGHNSQQLHENQDGTYSIVDPSTRTPYPGTMGMEKEKPYQCDTCQKRYKNLNGLKYHKTHSPPCNSDIRGPMGAAVNISVAGTNIA